MILHHIAYLVSDTARAIAAMPQPNISTVLYRKALHSQKAFITFVKSEGPIIELVEPFAENKTMTKRLERSGVSGVLYHLGYEVENFDTTYRDLRKSGWMPLSQPFEGLERGNRASHMFNPDFGIIEIMGPSAKETLAA